MKFKKEWLIGLIEEDETPLEYIEQTEWADEGKYSHKSYIFKYEDRYYILGYSRTGSYYSDYTYEDEYWPDEKECDEVHQVEKVIKVWEVVK